MKTIHITSHMKTLTFKTGLCLLAMVLSFGAIAQTEGVSIKSTAAAPDASAMLDVNHSSKGILIPRVILTSLTAPLAAGVTPQESLLIYNIGSNVAKGYYFWNGTLWKQIATGPELWTKVSTTNDIQYAAGRVNIGGASSTRTKANLEVVGATDNFYTARFKNAHGEMRFGEEEYLNSIGGYVNCLTQVPVTKSFSIRYSHMFPDSTRGLTLTSWLRTATDTPNVSIDANKNHLLITASKNIRFVPYLTSAGTGNFVEFNTGGSFVFNSDSTLKMNVTNMDPVLSKVLSLRPVRFNWISNPGLTKSTGLIAQEVNRLFPELVNESTSHVDQRDSQSEVIKIKSVDYISLTSILIKAVQEQQVQINALNARLTALENK